MKRRITTLVVAVTVLAGLAIPAGAEPQGFVEVEMGVGQFYGTFGKSPNLLLLVGGNAEEFCLDNPDDPFSAEPGTATFRIFERASGATDIITNSKNQPVYLYSYEGEVPDLLGATCDAMFDEDPATEPPAPLANGTGDLKVRIGVQPNGDVDVFNSVNGTVAAADGTQWKVKGWADFHVVDDVPVGDPPDFVFLKVRQIGG